MGPVVAPVFITALMIYVYLNLQYIRRIWRQKDFKHLPDLLSLENDKIHLFKRKSLFLFVFCVCSFVFILNFAVCLQILVTIYKKEEI